MAMTIETPPPDRIRPAAVAGLLLGDLIAPAAIYYAARALGAPVVPALILGGLACLPRQVAGLARRGRADGLGTAVLVATQGRPGNRPFWDQVWACGSAFRRCLRVLAIGWPVILLAVGAA